MTTLAVINPFAAPMEQGAQAYLRRGWAVFPLHWVKDKRCSCGKEQCHNEGKHPLTMHGFKDATTDPKQVTEWWQKWPEANIGIACGASRLVVVDVDPRNDGHEGVNELQRINGPLPATLTTLTGGGGWHYIYAVPMGAVPPRCWVPPYPVTGVEVKGDGGYIVAPPSSHVLGTYVKDSGQPEDTETAPEWLCKAPKKKLLLGGGNPREGILGAAFLAAGKLGRQLGPNKVTVECPWAEGHSVGEDHNSSTVVFGPAPGDNWGNFHCSHASCLARFEGLGREAKRKIILDALPKEATDAAKASVKGADREVAQVLRAPWEASLNYNNAGTALKADPGNLALLLSNVPEWQNCFKYDEARDRLYWNDKPPDLEGLRAPQGGDPIQEYDYIYIGQWFAMSQYRVSFRKDQIQDSVLARGNANRHNSLTTHLDSLVWDGVPRLGRWLTIFLGVEETEYTRFVGRAWLISAMARAYTPGCKADHVLVLEGRQGVGKTSTFEIIGGDWHLPDVPRIDNKDARGLLAAAWIAEFSELAAFRGVEFQKVKSFITERIDKYRPPYWRSNVERKRRCVFAGSTNEKDWIQDTTGARRFWPVHVTKVLFHELAMQRGALLAEARDAFHSGEAWHPAYEGQLEQIIKEQQAARIEEHPWEVLIAKGIQKHLHRDGDDYRPTMGDCFLMCNVPPERQDMQGARHIGRILRALGWTKKRGRVEGELEYVWVREE